MKRTLNGLILGAAVLAVGSQTLADRVYMPVDLGTLGGDQSVALGMNDSGTIVGWAETCQPLAERHGFIWKDGVMEDLGSLGGAWTEARAVNAFDVVVGTSTTATGEQRGFMWQGLQMYDLTELLRVPPGREKLADAETCFGQIEVFVEANDINDQGWIIGCAYMEADVYLHGILVIPLEDSIDNLADSALQGCLEFGYRYVDLGRLENDTGCIALAVSDLESVVGVSGTDAFLWQAGKIQSLEVFAALSQANDVNNNGTAVGWTDQSIFGAAPKACIWYGDYRADLGVEHGWISAALSLNDSELIVGYAAEDVDAPRQAFLWDGCIPYNLNDITVPPVRTVMMSWEWLTVATDIDREGRIVGFGTSADGNMRAFLLYDPTDGGLFGD